MPTVETPCGIWDVDTSCCADWDAFDAAAQATAITAATNLLWRLTGRRFGICTVAVRPCLRPDRSNLSTYASGFPYPPGALHPYGTFTSISADYVVAPSPHGSVMACDSCLPPARTALNLPALPAQEVTAVTVDGAAVPLASFSLLNHRTLVYNGGLFPAVQDLTLPLTEPNTWGVTYTYGVPLPDDGARAAGILACETAKLCAGLNCRLPRKTQMIQRQGITMELVPVGWLQQGLTGVQEVDEFIVSVNPYGLRERSRVYSPDKPPAASRVTWQGV